MAVPVTDRASSKQRSRAYFSPRRLGHVNLYVDDVDRSYKFYTTVAGLEESYIQPLNKAAFLGNNNTHHDVAVIDIETMSVTRRIPSGSSPRGIAVAR